MDLDLLHALLAICAVTPYAIVALAGWMNHAGWSKTLLPFLQEAFSHGQHPAQVCRR
jgi:hypothetical protein